MAQRSAKDRTRRTTSHTFRIGAVHTDLRHECVLQPLLANRDGSLYLNPATQETRLSVYLVTRQRTIAATDAKVHVHHEHVAAVDDACRDCFFGCLEHVDVWNGFECARRSVAGIREARQHR